MSAVELAGRVLARAPRGAAVQATVIRERSLMLRFARSRATQATAVDDLDVVVTAFREGHLASARTNALDDDALEACLRGAVAAADAAARSGGTGAHPGPAAPAPVPGHAGHDPQTALIDPRAGGDALRSAFAVTDVQGVEAHGIWTVGEVETGIASTTGVEAADRVTDAFMKVTAIAPSGRSGWSSRTGVGVAAIEGGAIAAEACEKLAPRQDPVQMPPGDYPVVLERHAVAELLQRLGEVAWNGLAHAEGRGALNGRLGTAVAAPCVTIADSPREPGTLSRAVDLDGVPKAPLTLIERGVARDVAHDLRSAALAGVRGTGHSTAPGGAPHGPRPTNLAMVGGTASDEAALCAPVERGIYVTRLWYVNAVRPAEALMTGVTRDGTFLIEDGRATRPLADMRFTDSFLGILERTEDLTAAPSLTSDGELYGRRFATAALCPALRASRMRFSE